MSHIFLDKAMGYDFHITRKDHWADDNGPIISLDEWTAYARGDADIDSDHDNPGPENWLVTRCGETWPLWWSDCGGVMAKNADPFMLEKMIAIANALEAHVLGDDGEAYNDDPDA